MENKINIKIDESLELLSRQMRILEEVREILHAKENEIKELKEQVVRLNEKISNATLDIRYSKVLVGFQRIDDMFRNLEANIASQNFKRNIDIILDDVFLSYGYRFVDFTEETKDFYDCEYQAIDAPEVVYRAVGRKVDSQTIEPAIRGLITLPSKK